MSVSAHRLRSILLDLYDSQDESWFPALISLLQACKSSERIEIKGAKSPLTPEQYHQLIQALSNHKRLEDFTWNSCRAGLVSDKNTERLDLTLDFVRSCPRLRRLTYLPEIWRDCPPDTVMARIGLELERHRVGYHEILKDEVPLNLLPIIIATKFRNQYFGRHILYELLKEKNGVVVTGSA
eukprot:CAMPEP_0202455732 /NCGR_PEP_ID=MMETSP1360-20130828/13184_1 /ASSEMBLY_ACC=CAM_ASM_000848 /TAXON_ID=515479 /ORGANISM="Licmophora paradoxa, Strain CCMP2313" /LENGTH=181 /DNA_ID=CAMNT_0049075375 /DNA_START=674 /DNA_END=1219 /DNA_ORIENTATION=+